MDNTDSRKPMIVEPKSKPKSKHFDIIDSLQELYPPGSPEAKIPSGWALDKQGLYKKVLSKPYSYYRRIAYNPIAIKRLLIEQETENELFVLSFFREGKWGHIIVKREIAMNKNMIPALAAYGFPVNTTNAKFIVDYLTAYEAQNIHLLVSQQSTLLQHLKGEA